MAFDLTRRKFLLGVGLVGIAPAIVKIDTIMRIHEPKLIVGGTPVILSTESEAAIWQRMVYPEGEGRLMRIGEAVSLTHAGVAGTYRVDQVKRRGLYGLTLVSRDTIS